MVIKVADSTCPALQNLAATLGALGFLLGLDGSVSARSSGSIGVGVGACPDVCFVANSIGFFGACKTINQAVV